ncbi:MAG: hypothetical protein ACOCVY_03385 [Patescibacteria group bacterium]
MVDRKEEYLNRKEEREYEFSPEEGKEEIFTPERSSERTGQEEEEKKRAEKELRTSSSVAPAMKQKDRIQRRKEIEKILQDGLEDMYKELDDEKKKIFREKGEKIASQINEYLDERRSRKLSDFFNSVKKKILRLIKQWLCLLNASKEFIEQEAKLKSDKIINMNWQKE